jgi:pimeloyl-ACP methyl ester carboxylesterase
MTAVLLIPGNMCDERLWHPVAGQLAAAGHTVRHAPRLDQSTIGAMADAVLSVVEEPVTAIGFSMGAIVAAEMARRAPSRIAALGLVAFNASADLPERAAVRPRQQQDVRAGRLAEIVADELKPNYLAAANRGDAAMLQTVMEMALALGPDAFVAQSEALRLRDDLRPGLPALAMPVLLACGSEDRLCPPEWHRRWAEMIGPNARFSEIHGAGHLLPLERPHALAEALLGWLAEETSCPTRS